ncbi:MAG: hypothetical protein CMJ23_13930 [Phycisphaerae bacterium]|nr:hypothetical protein [Phycisphaerae bacterium]
MLRTAVQRVLEGAEVESVSEESDLRDRLASGGDRPTVLMVNRSLDGFFDSADGIELIRGFHQPEAHHVAMLVSNLDDAQEKATQAGAIAGFGKTALNAAETGEVLLAAAEAARVRSIR